MRQLAALLACLLLMTVAVDAQQTPLGPLTSEITATGHSYWGVARPSAGEAEAYVRDFPQVYGKVIAQKLASERGGKLIDWSIAAVEIKALSGRKAYAFRARTLVEARIGPWPHNLPRDDAKNQDALPIQDEVSARIAELERLDEETSALVVDGAVSALMGKIGDIDVMTNALVSVVTRLGGKGATYGLWKGGLTADRYVDRLYAIADRVQSVRDSVTGLQGWAFGRTSRAIDDILQDLDALESDFAVTSEPVGAGWNDPLVGTFRDARSALRDAIGSARTEAFGYDIAMQKESTDRAFRAVARQRKTEEMRRDAILGGRQANLETVAAASDTDETAEPPSLANIASAKHEAVQLRLREALRAEDERGPVERPTGGPGDLTFQSDSDDAGVDQAPRVPTPGPFAGARAQLTDRGQGRSGTLNLTPLVGSPFAVPRSLREQEVQATAGNPEFDRQKARMIADLEDEIDRIQGSGQILRLVLKKRGFDPPEAEQTCALVSDYFEGPRPDRIPIVPEALRRVLCIPQSIDWNLHLHEGSVSSEPCMRAVEAVGLGAIRKRLFACLRVDMALEDTINGLVNTDIDRSTDPYLCDMLNDLGARGWHEEDPYELSLAGDFTFELKTERRYVQTQLPRVVETAFRQTLGTCDLMAAAPRDPVGSVAVFVEQGQSLAGLQNAVEARFGEGFVLEAQPATGAGSDMPDLADLLRAQGMELLSESRIAELREEMEWLHSIEP